MTNKVDISKLVGQLRDGINKNAGDNVAKTITKAEDLVQVANWIEMPEFFQVAVGGKGIPCGHITQVVGKSDTGKCHGFGTEIIMYDGTLKQVQDIEVGDRLMGPDSTPRTVLGLGSGKDEMFEILPNKGSESFECNAPHILSLYATITTGGLKKDNIYDIPLNEYLSLTPTMQKSLKLWRTSIAFEEKKQEFDPYWVGLWLGDGAKGTPSITNNEPELTEYYTNFAAKNNLSYQCKIYNEKCPRHTFTTPKSSENPILNFIREKLVVEDEKCIPHNYLTGSRQQRLELLAGLLDTDGHLDANTGTGFEITQKGKVLSDQIVFLSRSLGFLTTSNKVKKSIKSIGFTGEYYRIFISGKCSQIPTKIKRKQGQDSKINRRDFLSGFKVNSLGQGNYYGFELDGDRRYLLKDTTVTHNTTLIMESMVRCQKQGGIVFLLDSEHKFSFERFETMGGSASEITTLSVDSLEESWDALDNILLNIEELRKKHPDIPILLVWDSVAASVPDAILEADADKKHVSVEAKINNVNIRKLRKRIKKNNVAALFINHSYFSMPTFGFAEEIIKGGSEMFFMSTLILKTKRKGQLKRTVKGFDQKFGIKSALEVLKGHFSGRRTATEFWIVDRGIIETKEDVEEYQKSLRGKI